MTSPNTGDKTLLDWFNAPISHLDNLFSQARILTDEAFNRQISVFHPGSHFPSISITGTRCQLYCQHCAGRFLQQMHAINNPPELTSFCQNLAQQNGVGCLISGGCNDTGAIPLEPFLPAITEIKQSTSLFLNVHTGFLTETQANNLNQTGIDCASVDVVGDDSTIHTIYGLQHRTTADYISTLQALDISGLPTAPHICVGLLNGKLAGEFKALQLIKSTIIPKLLVIIALMPTKGTPMADSPPAQPFDVARICALARLLFPQTEIALGCMRPRGGIRHQMEKLAVEAGITRLVQPTTATLQYLEKNDYTINTRKACCVY